MRIRKRCFSLALPALLALGCWVSGMAQEAQSPAQGDVAQAPAVPTEIQEKARTYKGSPTPPRQLTKVADGHWTPYTLPEAPPEGAEVYTIVQGDTLSALAQQKMGSWLLWPQIWDLNPYITDAHWIYPGDPLFIKKPQVVNEQVPVGETITPKIEGPQPAAGAGSMQIEEEAAMPPVTARDVYCSGYITKNFRKPHLTLLSGNEPSREALGTGNVVYLNEGKADGIEPGALYGIIEVGQEVSHPQTGKPLGIFIRKVGQAKILTVQEHTSIAEISQACDEITYGDVLVPWKAIPIPWDIKRADSLPLEVAVDQDKYMGRVIWTEDRLQSTGQHSLVYVNLGAAHKILPGDKLWFFRFPARGGTLVQGVHDLFREQKINVGPKDLYRKQKVGKRAGDAKGSDDETAGVEGVAKSEMPGWVYYEDPGVDSITEVIGEGVVITTEPDTACVKIINSTKEITFGDWVRVE